MEDSILLKIALVLSITGILVLFLLSNTINPEEININKIDKNKIDKTVKIRGITNNIKKMDNLMFIDIIQNNKITVVLFNDKDVEIEKGNKVEIIGKVKEYKDGYEIIGDKIIVI